MMDLSSRNPTTLLQLWCDKNFSDLKTPYLSAGI